MASAIRLAIETTVDPSGIIQARQKLEELGANVTSTNQALKTKNVDVISTFAKLRYETERFMGGEQKAAQSYLKDLDKIMMAVSQSGGSWSQTGPNGGLVSVSDVEVLKQFADISNDVLKNVETFSATQNGGKPFNVEQFFGDVEKQGNNLLIFGTELESVQKKMSLIKDQGTRLIAAGGSPEDIAKLSKEYKILTSEQDRLKSSSESATVKISGLFKQLLGVQSIIVVLQKAISVVTSFIKESSQLAAVAEQTAGRFETVFEGVNKAAKASSNISLDFGLSPSTSKDILSKIADIAVGMGASKHAALEFAETWAGFTQDIIAFKDIAEDAISFTDSMMSGLAGNTRNFRQIGSIVREATVEYRLQQQGLDALTGSSLEWAKMQERAKIVMEQQKNAIGATTREWDTMLAVNRRLNEQWKLTKELAGTYINQTLHPIKSAILDLVSAWNLAAQAEQNYLNKEAEKNAELYSSDNELGKQSRELLGGYYNATGIASQAQTQHFELTIDTFDDINTYADVIIKDITEAYKRFGMPWEEALEFIIPKLEKTKAISEDEVEVVREHFRILDQIAAAEQARIARLERAASFGAALNAYQEGLSELTGGFGWGGVRDFVNLEPSEFLSGIDALLSTTTDNAHLLESQLEAVREVAEYLYNQKLYGENETIQGEAAAALEVAIAGYKQIKNEIEALTFESYHDGLFQQIREFETKTNLENKFGKDNTDIVNIYMQEWRMQQAALKQMNERVAAGMDAVQAEEYRLHALEIIAELTALELDYNKQITLEKERQEFLENRIASQKETQKLADENRWKRDEIGGSWLPSLFVVGEDVRQAQIDRDQKIEAQTITLAERFSIDLSGIAPEFDNDEALQAYLRNLDEFNTQRLAYELEVQQSYMLEIEAMRRTVLEQIDAQFMALGDLQMLDTFSEISNLAGSAAGWMYILGTFTQYLESVNEVLSIFSIAMEAIAPVIDQFLAPLVVLLTPIIDVLNVIIPILNILFPVLKVVAIAFNTVATVINWFAKVVEYAAGKITFWTKKDNISWSDVQNTWTDGMDRNKEIWDMEISARAEYVRSLTESQNAELKVYESLYKDGLLTFNEFEAMVQKNIYGKSIDTSDPLALGTSGVWSGHLGDTIEKEPIFNYGDTNYTINIDGSNADPQEIARLVAIELQKTNRREAS